MSGIAVAGGSGFIGQALVEALVRDGHRIEVSYFENEPHEPRPDCSWFQIDLRSPEMADYFVKGADVVYHCAGITTGSGGAGIGGRNLVGDNVRIALNLFEACARAGVKKVIVMSSTTGYPEWSDPTPECLYFYGKPHEAYKYVGESKRFIERLGAMYPEFEVTFIRCAGAYGPWADFDSTTSHVIEASIRKVAEKQNPIVIWGSGEEERDAVYIDDLVRALILAKDAPPGAYNIGTGKTVSINWIVRKLMDIAGYDPEDTRIEHDLTKPVMIHRRLLDVTKARIEFKWKATVGMEEGLRRTLEWYRENMKCQIGSV